MKVQKKPVVVDAFRWMNDPADQPPEWFQDAVIDRRVLFDLSNGEPKLIILTPEGSMIAGRGDWIIRGIVGELYPCKPEIFDRTYDHLPECDDTRKAYDVSKVYEWQFRFPPDFHLMTPSAIEQVLQEGLLEVRSKILVEREAMRRAGVRVGE